MIYLCQTPHYWSPTQLQGHPLLYPRPPLHAARGPGANGRGAREPQGPANGLAALVLLFGGFVMKLSLSFKMVSFQRVLNTIQVGPQKKASGFFCDHKRTAPLQKQFSYGIPDFWF